MTSIQKTADDASFLKYKEKEFSITANSECKLVVTEIVIICFMTQLFHWLNLCSKKMFPCAPKDGYNSAQYIIHNIQILKINSVRSKA